ncbi:gamma carbonic anhydrase family protein [Phenylobacterium sp. SCN 70-31]|uniref:gamma carbonic anhydrase family protein n=1 Tax=Phenylobacterium sp. SCN 70-31 TaxID=1660129 RepID=UPI00086F8F35|nr:gamma carbonic anhydrase family protein [Phenylobacterium sp. SCN 70-31]ODT88492.1 MAG: gamma carbonic anhydrase family protein [Phenylobacterium sp. SCN 70-31]
MERGSARAFGPEVAVDVGAFIHPTAQVYGRVRVAAGASIWPNVVVRAESQEVVIGARTNIQDFVMIHVGAGTGTIVGEDCSITHHVTLHGCRIGDRVLVGIGATVMDGCEIGDNSIIAGHAFLKEGTVIPPNSIVMGAPARVVRERDSAAANAFNAWMYRENAEAYAAGEHRLWSTAAFGERARVERARLEALHHP